MGPGPGLRVGRGWKGQRPAGCLCVQKGRHVSPSGNRTPVSRVTGGDTHHYTNEDHAHRHTRTAARLPHHARPTTSVSSNAHPVLCTPPQTAGPRDPAAAPGPGPAAPGHHRVARWTPSPSVLDTRPSLADLDPGTGWPGGRACWAAGIPTGTWSHSGAQQRLHVDSTRRAGSGRGGAGRQLEQPDATSPAPARASAPSRPVRLRARARAWAPDACEASAVERTAAVRMAERSKALRSGRSLPWRRGFESHF